METFTKARKFVADAGYGRARRSSLAALDLASIDPPIRDIVAGFAELTHSFTLQCCYGHFLCGPEQDLYSLAPIPDGYSGPVRYRIAYIAVCLENSPRGRALCRSLAELSALDPDNIQFGSADWFWERHVNSYALQVEPVAYSLQDEAVLEPDEARRLQQVRDRFFAGLRALLAEE